MLRRLSAGRLAELWRYYQAGVINTLFGFGLYALLVKIGANIYLAQIISHVLGVIFNYLTYSRHVFRDSKANKLRFLISYVGSYFLSLGALAISIQFVRSPYVAGLMATLAVSLINYFALKYMVFAKPSAL